MKKMLITAVVLMMHFYAWAQMQIGASTYWISSSDTYVVMDSLSFQYDAPSISLDNIIKFTGNKNVYITGATLPVFSKLNMALTGNTKLILQRAVNVSGNITFSSGLLDLNNNIIDLGSTGTISGESEVSRAIGPNGGYLKTTVVLNAPVNANPGNIGVIITSSQNMGSTTIQRGHQVQPGLPSTNGSISRYYDIIPTNNTGLNATLRFFYFDAELNNLMESGLALWRSNDQTTWSYQGFTSKDQITNYVEKTGINDFSRWTLSTANSPIPVEFTFFNARCDNGAVSITWKTAQEFNSSHFAIERSAGLHQWVEIGNIHSAGNSSFEKTYNFIDTLSVPNAIYRIAQYDVNGRVKYTQLLKPGCQLQDDWKVWPNPISDNAWLSISTSIQSKLLIRIFDSKGALVMKQQSDLLPGNNVIQMKMGKIAAGSYQLTAYWNNGQIRKSIQMLKQ